MFIFIFGIIAAMLVFDAVWLAMRWEGLSEAQRRGLVIPGSLVVLGVIMVAYVWYRTDPRIGVPPEAYELFVLIGGIALAMQGARMIGYALLRDKWAKKRGAPG